MSVRAIQKEALSQKPNKHSNSNKITPSNKQINKKETVKDLSTCATPYPILSRLFSTSLIVHSDPGEEIFYLFYFFEVEVFIDIALI